MTSAASATSDEGFDAATALTILGEGTFRGDVSAAWTIAGRPNGGYLLAMLGRAATV
jgi:hypothetical protein